VFKYFILSVILVPPFLGILAARARGGRGSPALLRMSWVVYTVLWFGVLHFVRYRWAW
jgi:hypothetical protein